MSFEKALGEMLERYLGQKRFAKIMEAALINHFMQIAIRCTVESIEGESARILITGFCQEHNLSLKQVNAFHLLFLEQIIAGSIVIAGQNFTLYQQERQKVDWDKIIRQDENSTKYCRELSRDRKNWQAFLKKIEEKKLLNFFEQQKSHFLQKDPNGIAIYNHLRDDLRGSYNLQLIHELCLLIFAKMSKIIIEEDDETTESENIGTEKQGLEFFEALPENETAIPKINTWSRTIPQA